ncbi:DNA repair protein [Achromobacter insuavis]
MRRGPERGGAGAGRDHGRAPARPAAQHHPAAAAVAERAGPGQRRQGRRRGQRDAAQKELEALRGQLAKAKGQADKLAEQQGAVMESAQAQVAASHAQLGKFKGAYDELLTLSRAKEAERQTLARSLAQRETEAKACVAKNREMYEAGKEILNAYERISTGGILAMKQPFAGSARVKFEEQAQAYGDKLYDAQVGATAPAAAPAQP